MPSSGLNCPKCVKSCNGASCGRAAIKVFRFVFFFALALLHRLLERWLSVCYDLKSSPNSCSTSFSLSLDSLPDDEKRDEEISARPFYVPGRSAAEEWPDPWRPTSRTSRLRSPLLLLRLRDLLLFGFQLFFSKHTLICSLFAGNVRNLS